MKDKILLPAIIITLILLVIFMLICIKTQLPLIKDLTDEVEKIRTAIQKDNDIKGLKTDVMQMQNEIRELKTKTAGIRLDIINLQAEVNKSARRKKR